MKGVFQKVGNDQEQIPCGNGMGENNGVRFRKPQRKIIFFTLFLKMREVEL